MKNFKKGFTLVEMLIVVVIIGILAAALLPRLTGIQASARDTGRKADIQQIVSAIGAFNARIGKYPDVITNSSSIISASAVADELVANNVVNSLPRERVKNVLGQDKDYAIVALQKGGVAKQAIAIVAQVETTEAANYVKDATDPLVFGGNLEDIKLCTSVNPKIETNGYKPSKDTTNGEECKASSVDQLYFVAIQ